MRNVLIFYFVFLTLSMSAQTLLERPELYIGASGGVTSSQVLFNPTVKQNFLNGANAGFSLRYIAEKNVGVQTEINFSQRGWSEIDSNFSKQLNYIELPFLTHIYFGNKLQCIINLGPKISYLLSEKVLSNSLTLNTEVQQKTNIQNRFDYGLCGGIGVQLKAHQSIYYLDMRLNYGLSDIFSNDKRDYFDASNNFNISVNVGYYFKLR